MSIKSFVFTIGMGTTALFATAAQAKYRFIDSSKILIGQEPTFQDPTIIAEKGRMTFQTPYKLKKFELMISNYLAIVGPSKSANGRQNFGDPTFKPGANIIGGDGIKAVTTMEPVCIEWNKPPVTVDQLADNWRPVFNAAKKADLVAYVNPAAERSGMGHNHIGGPSVGQNPFIKSPTLLRNTFAYFQQHPSLLWGFAEAYDIGQKSNIETYHSQTRQDRLERVIRTWDQWYASASKSDRKDGGFKFLSLLYAAEPTDFFEHYRFLNLEHMTTIARLSPDSARPMKGKYTVEFRNFRPPKSPEHAAAQGELLLAVMDQLADPAKLVPFRKISQDEYANFYSAAVVRADWDIVKAELTAPLNPLWDEMLNEYVDNIESKLVRHPMFKELFVAPTYSEKGKKGEYIELLVPAGKSAQVPNVEINNQPTSFQKITINSKTFWAAVVRTNLLGVTPESVMTGQGVKMTFAMQAPTCRMIVK